MDKKLLIKIGNALDRLTYELEPDCGSPTALMRYWSGWISQDEVAEIKDTITKVKMELAKL